MIIGLDIATNMGVAHWTPGAPRPFFSTVRLPSDPEEVGRPMEKLRATLADLHKLDPITHMFFEATILPGRTNIHTVNKLCSLCGMAEWFAYRIGIGRTTRRVEQQSWRKHFIGRGTGKSDELKRAAMDACRMRGWMVGSDHEADALGVLDYGLTCFGIETPWRDAHLFAGRMRG